MPPKSKNLSEWGSVTLVGAGPGDPEMLTLKAVKALKAADVVLYDALVSDEVLAFVRDSARKLAVGKRGGRRSCRQDDINALMVRFAREGKAVVRLKAGDPMVFGRAGEEISMLERHGIAVSVVPGITAAAAMAASLGVSLTHRDFAQSVRFVTGHSKEGRLPAGLDWQSIASSRATTIFYMGRGTAAQIADNMMAAGAVASLPAVAVAAASRSTEQRWWGPLAKLGEGVAGLDVSQPILIGVGEVFAGASVAVDRVSCRESLPYEEAAA